MVTIYVGVDPGTANLGLACGKDARALKVKGAEAAITTLEEYLRSQFDPDIPQDVVVSCEAYTFFGMRKNFGPMNRIIGVVQGLCMAFGFTFYLFEPREKERAGKTLTRPRGQEDHAWDARCLAALGRERHDRLQKERWGATGN